MLRLIHCSCDLREGILSLHLSCFVPSICRLRESIPTSECARSDLSPAKFFEIPSNHPLPASSPCPVQEHGSPPKPPKMCVQKPSSNRDVGRRGENCTRERTDFKKGTEELPEPQTSHQQHSPAHRPQSITKPSPALHPPPSHPPKCSKNTFKALFYF